MTIKDIFPPPVLIFPFYLRPLKSKRTLLENSYNVVNGCPSSPVENIGGFFLFLHCPNWIWYQFFKKSASIFFNHKQPIKLKAFVLSCSSWSFSFVDCTDLGCRSTLWYPQVCHNKFYFLFCLHLLPFII
ncbi:hypothetical protein ACH5RR_023699 [Cinchona calisaya]|uniref:Uncharacterized protein n=1 Tax=Cinchona calisaya TaxID=153742 RepID=A0ABD2ZF95_9GENT